jgi:glutamate dehydrogenase/leucine dehydrogenase
MKKQMFLVMMVLWPTLLKGLPKPKLPKANACLAMTDMTRYEQIIESEKNDFLSASRATFSHIVGQAKWAAEAAAESIIRKMFKPEIEIVFKIKRPKENLSTGEITYKGEINASRIIQSTKGGPAGGGVRIAENAIIRDSFALSLEQQLKNLLLGVMGINANGAKGVIAVDGYSLTQREFHSVIRQYVRKLAQKGVLDPKVDKPAPDVGFRAFQSGGRAFNMMDLMLNELCAYTAQHGKFADPKIDAGMKKFMRKHGPASDRDLGAPVWANEYVRLAKAIPGRKSLAEAAVFTGKSADFFGLEGRVPATGYGGYVFSRRALQVLYGTTMKNRSVAVQGFGNVGRYYSLNAYRDGAKVVRIADVKKENGELKGLILDAPGGINIEKLFEHVERGEPVSSYEQSGLSSRTYELHEANDIFVSSKVEILVPAALQKVITADNVSKVRAQLVLELANGPLDPAAQAALAVRGIPALADFLANSGGVFASFLERQQNLDGKKLSAQEVRQKIEYFMERNFDATHAKMMESGAATLRTAGGLRAVDRWYDNILR